MIAKKTEEVIKMSFVGDILPANLPYTIGYGNYSAIDKATFEDAIEKPDIFLANLESPILYKNGNNEDFSGNVKVIDFFNRQGINIVNIANNHILEKGEEGFFETIKILRDNNIRVIGILDDEKNSNVEVFEIYGVRIAFAGFNGVHDIKNPSLYAELNYRAIETTLIAMKLLNADYKILTFHWGNEFISLPSPEQISFAKFAIDNGCDLILGHHPHVIQKYEIIKDKYVFYSLGNAYFDYLFSSSVNKGLRVDCSISNEMLNVDCHVISVGELGFKKLNTTIDLLQLSKKDLLKVNSSQYNLWYYRLLKRIRFVNRVKMKVYFFYLLLKLPIKQKRILLNNLTLKINTVFNN